MSKESFWASLAGDAAGQVLPTRSRVVSTSADHPTSSVPCVIVPGRIECFVGGRSHQGPDAPGVHSGKHRTEPLSARLRYSTDREVDLSSD